MMALFVPWYYDYYLPLMLGNIKPFSVGDQSTLEPDHSHLTVSPPLIPPAPSPPLTPVGCFWASYSISVYFSVKLGS